MNPFTESTVARPLSGLPSPAANEDASYQDTPRDPVPVSAEAERSRKPARHPRSGRIVRRRTRGQVSRRLGWALSWPGHCRRAASLALGLLLAFSLPSAWAVNANSATAQQLETITGIGPKTAQTIIDERTRGGSFESFDDLSERVKGIGPKKVRSLQAAGLTLGQAGSTDLKAASPAQRKASR